MRNKQNEHNFDGKADEIIRFREIQAGNLEIQEKIIKDNLFLAATIAKKYSFTNIGEDDLIEYGAMGLVKATETYHPLDERNFQIYAMRLIENEVLFSLGKQLRNHLDILDSRDKEIIELRYGLADGVIHSVEEISELFGVSKSFVTKKEKSAVEKLFTRVQQLGS